MKIDIQTNYGRLTCVDMPYIPRVGESIHLSNMPYMYDERNGKSQNWIVTNVTTFIGEWKDYDGDPRNIYEGVTIQIKNEDDE